MSQGILSMGFVLGRAPVIPVLAIDDPATAVPLARALVNGGLPVLEITLRTPQALAAVEAIARAVPEALPGVGTYTQAADAARARDAGARFLVSPGTTQAVMEAAAAVDLPLLPGVATASEVMRALAAGLTHLKFFPAEANGGTAALRALHGPFAEARFCPTGGIRPDNYLDYLGLPNVLCVGGTWLAPEDAVAARDWARIRALAAQVSGRRLPPAASVGDAPPQADAAWYSVAGEEDPGSADEDLR